MRLLKVICLRSNRRETEKEINGFPQFTYEIEGLRIHFIALFSEKQDAKPIAFFHGWPGRFGSATR